MLPSTRRGRGSFKSALVTSLEGLDVDVEVEVGRRGYDPDGYMECSRRANSHGTRCSTRQGKKELGRSLEEVVSGLHICCFPGRLPGTGKDARVSSCVSPASVRISFALHPNIERQYLYHFDFVMNRDS